MKRFMKIVFKVVFSIILLFLCLAFKPHEARAEFFNGGIFADDDEFLDLINDAFTEDVAPKAEWISVEERVPDNGETVLTVDNEGYMIVASWYELGGWFLPVCRANPVTHWMPLPVPPKGE